MLTLWLIIDRDVGNFMKKLHLIRHAKSSWADPELKDKQRPLNKRGIKACGVMARPILMAASELDTIFCSPAVRTQQTIELIDKNLKKISFTGSWIIACTPLTRRNY
ncbi:SixA phosphatase family protein [Oceanospirillum sediminis]|uniref:Histidine phosphatase family protein n=1 Tax=Oceanospirillum sediminis TaxID=2760088 RepID=A0A839IUA3_9GAMM|nr:histidine phosphatase family protein [Oceanospirillum sediminis]MBB1488511.1 histidine phosphatase family protein [Oceanospirillum sediminis]